MVTCHQTKDFSAESYGFSVLGSHLEGPLVRQPGCLRAGPAPKWMRRPPPDVWGSEAGGMAEFEPVCVGGAFSQAFSPNVNG